jgi:signal transduction histidine kinase
VLEASDAMTFNKKVMSFSKDCKEITIELKHTGKIVDQGIGMSKAVLKRIFEKFYREHTGDIHNVKGHGLGLAYVKRILDDHDAQVSVESEKEQGSTFTINLHLIA